MTLVILRNIALTLAVATLNGHGHCPYNDSNEGNQYIKNKEG